MNTIQGVVTYSRVESVPHPGNGTLVRNACRVHMRQQGRGTPAIEAIVDTGPGSDGLLRAQAMCMRLRPGVEAQAVGAELGTKPGRSPREVTLVLRHCSHIMGGEFRAHHEPTSAEATA